MTDIVRIDAANSNLLDNVAVDVFDHDIQTDRLAGFLAQPNHLLFVAADDGAVIGHIRGMILHSPDKGPVLYIDNLGVTPGRQREGIATRLMQAVAGEAARLGAKESWVATEIENDAANGFYRALGLPAIVANVYEAGGEKQPD